jgi:hypothetical protein
MTAYTLRLESNVASAEESEETRPRFDEGVARTERNRDRGDLRSGE